ncbi:MAG: hypothetical protein GXP55_09085 [Deltaproteobacteria bacterium]|nr:hypothetical protein [Deltaproteobacteria bacterium]
MSRRTLSWVLGLSLLTTQGCSGGRGPEANIIVVDDIVEDGFCALAVRIYDPETRVDYRDAIERLDHLPEETHLAVGAWELEFYEDSFDCPRDTLFDEAVTLTPEERRLYVATNRDGTGAEELLRFDYSDLPPASEAVLVLNLTREAVDFGVDADLDGVADAPISVGSDAKQTFLAPRADTTQTFVASGSSGSAQNQVRFNDFLQWDTDFTVCSVTSDRAGGVAVDCHQIAERRH